VGRSPTPIIFYNVEGELDFLAIENDDRQSLDDTQKLDDGMMQTGGRDGERRHLLQKALSIFVQEDPYMVRLLRNHKYIDIVNSKTRWVKGVSFFFFYFYLSRVCC
jgi:hypothetical protein